MYRDFFTYSAPCVATLVQLAKEVAARKEAEQKAATGGLNKSTDQVGKPAGTAGEKGFSLIAEMMLEDDKEHYLAIQVSLTPFGACSI